MLTNTNPADLGHSHADYVASIDGGQMDGFARRIGDVSMGYYEAGEGPTFTYEQDKTPPPRSMRELLDREAKRLAAEAGEGREPGRPIPGAQTTPTPNDA